MFLMIFLEFFLFLVTIITNFFLKIYRKIINYLSPGMRSIYFRGLANLGNTCFMNSSLQVLYTIDDFRDYILEEECPKPLHYSLSQLFKSLNTNRTEGPVYPKNFRNAFIRFKPEFGDRRQHDAHEFIRFLIDGIHEEYNETKEQFRLEDDALEDIFMGQIRSIIKCSECQNQSNNLEEFWDISLALPESGDECQLEECLSNYTKTEVLDTTSKCNKCKQMTNLLKKIIFERLPKVLMIHLKKFGNNGHKISKEVLICQNLCIKSMDYELMAFITHRGMSSSSGHYISHCKQTETWLQFDDEDCIELKNHSIDMSAAYILFYQKSN